MKEPIKKQVAVVRVSSDPPLHENRKHPSSLTLASKKDIFTAIRWWWSGNTTRYATRTATHDGPNHFYVHFGACEDDLPFDMLVLFPQRTPNSLALACQATLQDTQGYSISDYAAE